MLTEKEGEKKESNHKHDDDHKEEGEKKEVNHEYGS